MDGEPRLTALLALDDRDGAPCANRALYASTPAILRQLDMAVALGCDAVAVLAASPGDPDVLATQHLAERAGLAFTLVMRTSRLSGAIRGGGDLLLLAPGAGTADAETLHTLLARPTLLTLDADGQRADGLERLDLHTAWAGALRMPASLVAQLDPLGDDCEPLSALPRIARSAGIPPRAIDDAEVEKDQWRIGGGSAAPGPGTDEPHSLLARLAMLGARFLGSRNWPVAVPIGAAVAGMLAAAVLVWLGHFAWSILASVGAIAMFAIARELAKLAEPLRLSGAPELARMAVLPRLPDLLVALAIGSAIAAHNPLVSAIYSALFTLLSVWLAAIDAEARPRFEAWLVWLGIAALGAVGLWWPAVYLATGLGLAAVARALWAARRITRL